MKPAHVLLAWPHNDQDHPQYEISQEALHFLENSVDAKGRQIKVTKLHNPPPMYYTQSEIDSFVPLSSSPEEEDEDNNNDQQLNAREVGTRLAASYVNLYIGNKSVVIPGFGFPDSDKNAFQTIQRLFPDRKVIQIPNSREILLGGGNIHCITAQIPHPKPEGR